MSLTLGGGYLLAASPGAVVRFPAAVGPAADRGTEEYGDEDEEADEDEHDDDDDEEGEEEEEEDGPTGEWGRNRRRIPEAVGEC